MTRRELPAPMVEAVESAAAGAARRGGARSLRPQARQSLGRCLAAHGRNKLAMIGLFIVSPSSSLSRSLAP